MTIPSESSSGVFTPPNRLSVLLISNNPIEMSKIYEYIKKVRGRSITLNTAFSMAECVGKALRLRPDCILIDDSFSKSQIEEMVTKVNKHKNINTSFALLKTSNYGVAAANGIQEFMLKDDLSSEKLVRSILNAMRLKQTQNFLVRTYRVNKRLMKRIIRRRKTKLGLRIEKMSQQITNWLHPAV